MRFARIAAALVLLVSLTSPLHHAVRQLFELVGVVNLPASSWGGGTVYLLFLLGLYAVLTVAFWLAHLAARATDRWQNSGLASFDRGLHASWPARCALVLGLFAVTIALWTGGPDRAPAVAEAAACAVAVIVAVGGSAPVPAEEEGEYDPLPQPVPREPESDPGGLDASDSIPLTLSWFFRREPGNSMAQAACYEVQLRASRGRLEELRRRDHTVKSKQDYVRFVRDGMTPEVAEMAWQIRQLSERDQLGGVGEINNVLAFAQRFRYSDDEADKGRKEYPRFPLELLVDDQGDCEDHAILAAACLLNLGYDARLVAVDYPSGPGHMALGVAGPDDLPGAFFLEDGATGRWYYYCEVTNDAASRDPGAVAFRMGEVPSRDRDAGLLLLPSV